MKAIILCGGLGTRLLPITYSMPKQLIPIGQKPILSNIIDSLLKANILDIGIIYNNNKSIFEKALEQYEIDGVKLKYIKQEKPIGLANAVLASEDFIGDDSFVMILGDNYYEISIREFIDSFTSHKSNCHILLKEVNDPKRFGIAKVENNQIVDVVEKPKDPPSNLAITGIYSFDSNIFEACKSIKPSWRGEYEITDAIKWLLNNNYGISYEIINGKWSDVGKPEDILETNSYILSKIKEEVIGDIDCKTRVTSKLYLGKGSKVINSIIRGPVYIGEDTVIENSYIGPYTSIHNNVILMNCTIENSIVLDNCIISNIQEPIDSSIIGENTEIAKSTNLRKASSFLISSNSKITII